MDGHVEVAVTTRVAPAVLAWCVRCTYRYIFDAAGRLAIVVEGEVEGDAPSTFGRVGLAMALVPAFEEVAWYGRGPHETYPDSIPPAGWAAIGRQWTSSRRRMSCLKRTATEATCVGAASRTATGVLAVGAPSIGFSVHRWSTAALAAAAHSDELMPEPRTWLHFDHRQHGLALQPAGRGLGALRVSGPFRFSVGLWPGSPLAVDPGAGRPTNSGSW